MVTKDRPELTRGLNDFGFAPIPQANQQWAFVSGSLIRAYIAYVARAKSDNEEPMELMQWLNDAPTAVAQATLN
jgi:hypothetical protein